ncbi:MAG TPA: hypothetical protein PKO25_09355 [Spirochaetota bacterium]|nr:hypothetical protein [Spirochaetota bacterium]HNU92067.1 hypothetical protein [Spirochaetota bacterium]HPV97996.1 hypothetical protein [Spirochaetota bacterium]
MSGETSTNRTIRLLRAMAITLALFSAAQWATSRGDEGAASEARRIHERMETLFRNWDRGLFGSRRFHRRELESFLAARVGQKIATGFDYPLVHPEALSAGSFRCGFRYGAWLEVRGEMSEADLRALAGGEASRPSRWWRLPLLVSLEGRLRRFRLDDGPPRTVIIVLEDLRPVSPRGEPPHTP